MKKRLALMLTAASLALLLAACGGGSGDNNSMEVSTDSNDFLNILVNGAAFCVNPYLIQIRHNVIGCHNIVFIRFPQEKLQDKIGL